MKVSWTRNTLTIVLAFFVSSISAHCADSRDTWKSVQQLPHHASFMFLEQDRSCHFGQIQAVSDQSVIVRTDKSDVTIARANLLRIQRGRPSAPSVNLFLPLSVVYSGRSSWADILMFMPLISKWPSAKVRISVATTDGKLRKGDLKEVAEAEIILRDSFGKETQISRTDVSRVDYIRTKPLSDQQEFDWEELAMFRIFDPVLYPRMFHAVDTIPVRLYDSALSEDDSPAQCRKPL